ncbi:hypothetical protein PENTCL1PPCAC_17854, partial [Pristionchus entomophagus]
QMKVEDLLRGLLEEELYDDVCLLYEMNATSTKGMNKHTKVTIHRMSAQAYFHQGRYELALARYNDAALMIASSGQNEEEADMRYRIAKCHYEMGCYDKAMEALNQIKLNHQKARMKKLEIELWKKMGVEEAKSKDPILDAHLVCVASCPQSVTSLSYLARRRERKKKDSLSIPSISDLPFLSHWWAAHTAWGNDDLIGAVTSLLNNASLAPRRAYLEAGEMLFYIGMKEDAVDLLMKAHRIDRDNKDGLTLLVNALGQLAVDEVERLKDLEEVVMELTVMKDESAEALIAYGQLARVKEKAAAMMRGRNTDATLLKMQILNDIERYRELLEIGTSVLRRDPHNIDVYEQMVSANLVLKKHDGARLLALAALNEIPGPRSALLYAHVLSFKTEHPQDKGIEELRKVVDKYPFFVDAAEMLAETLMITHSVEHCNEALCVLQEVMKRVPFLHRIIAGHISKSIANIQLRKNEWINAYQSMHKSVMLGAETTDSPMADLNEKMGEEMGDRTRGEPMDEEMAMTPSPSISVPNPTAPFGNRRRRRNEP